MRVDEAIEFNLSFSEVDKEPNFLFCCLQFIQQLRFIPGIVILLTSAPVYSKRDDTIFMLGFTSIPHQAHREISHLVPASQVPARPFQDAN